MASQEVQKYTIAGVAVMVAWGESFQVFGALNSSPWTARKFGSDEDVQSCRDGVRKAIVNNLFMGGLGSALLYFDGKQRFWWMPVTVTSGISFWMWKQYDTALKHAVASNSKGWGNSQ